MSKTNQELKEIATEVKAEVDSLDEEIDSLRERAGVPKGDLVDDLVDDSVRNSAQVSPAADTLQSTDELDFSSQSKRFDLESSPESSQKSSQDSATEQRSELTLRGASLGVPVRGVGGLAIRLPPRGGPAHAVDAFDLLEAAKQRVPELDQALKSAVKPALEKALAEEAAYPDGQPVVGVVEVSSEFGLRSNPFGRGGYEVHEGIDFASAHGDIIAATGDGVVILSGSNGGYGITVTIDHGYGYKTLYAHMSETQVKEGDRVKRGQIIGHVGNTGRSSGPHLHYGVYKNDKAINPRTVLKLPAE